MTLQELETSYLKFVAKTERDLLKLSRKQDNFEKFIAQMIESWSETGTSDATLKEVIARFGELNKVDEVRAEELGIVKNRLPR